MQVGAKHGHLPIVTVLALRSAKGGESEGASPEMPPMTSSPWAPLAYRMALVLREGLFVLRETLQGIKVQPLHDGHKLPRAGLGIGEER